MLIKIYGAAVQGIDAIVVTIEVSVEPGVGFNLVGLPDTAVKESYQRTMTAIRQSGYDYPRRSVVVNMAPADVRKEGAAYDLPIALGILAASESFDAARLDGFMIMGELSLDGSVLPIRGALPMAIKAREQGFKGMIVPKVNVTEAAIVDGIEVYGAGSLKQVVEFFNNQVQIEPTVSIQGPGLTRPAMFGILILPMLKDRKTLSVLSRWLVPVGIIYCLLARRGRENQ